MANNKKSYFLVPVLIVLVSALLVNGQSTAKESYNGENENAVSMLQTTDAIMMQEISRRLDTLNTTLSSILADQLKELERRLDVINLTQMKTAQLTNGFSKRLAAIGPNFIGPRDCADIQASVNCTDGVYDINLPGKCPVSVFCDFDNRGTAWLVIQKRVNGNVDFTRSYNDYASGFGTVSGEFWLGNDLIHLLTYNRAYKLRVEVEDRYAEYRTFSVGPASDKYRLTVNGYSGNAGDSLQYHNGMKFSTIDQDNDNNPNGNCARERNSGGWWWNFCHYSNLNGQYNNNAYGLGINWEAFRGWYYSLKTTTMKIARVN